MQTTIIRGNLRHKQPGGDSRAIVVYGITSLSEFHLAALRR